MPVYYSVVKSGNVSGLIHRQSHSHPGQRQTTVANDS